MGRITTEQYNHIIKMRLAGESLEDIQAYMAKCIKPEAYHEEQAEKEKKGDDLED